MRPILPGVAIDRFAVNHQISEKRISLGIYIRSSWNKLEQVAKLNGKSAVDNNSLTAPYTDSDKRPAMTLSAPSGKRLGIPGWLPPLN